MPPKSQYPQPKNVRPKGLLTQKGADWLEDHGGLDYIDRLAWGIEDEPDLNDK